MKRRPLGRRFSLLSVYTDEVRRKHHRPLELSGHWSAVMTVLAIHERLLAEELDSADLKKAKAPFEEYS